MTAGHLVVAERRTKNAEEEGGWSQLAKALEESERKAELDGRNLREDTENYCSLVRTLDLALIARPFPLVLSTPWAALVETEQLKAVDEVVLAVGPISIG